MGRHRASRILQPERQRPAAPAPLAAPAPAVAPQRPSAPAAPAPLQRAVRLGHRVVQAKLTLGPADDTYERQADATAREVMQAVAAPGPVEAATAEVSAAGGAAAQRAMPDLGESDDDLLSAKRLQRAAMPEEPEEERVFTQRVFTKAADTTAGGPIAGDVERAIDGARSGGKALDAGVRGAMEPAFGADFGGVRVHTGGEAHQLNQTLQARAFTTGPDIFFRQGEYRPEQLRRPGAARPRADPRRAAGRRPGPARAAQPGGRARGAVGPPGEGVAWNEPLDQP